jgi:hypothetical protein
MGLILVGSAELPELFDTYLMNKTNIVKEND